jgi:hypothetical protein
VLKDRGGGKNEKEEDIKRLKFTRSATSGGLISRESCNFPFYLDGIIQEIRNLAGVDVSKPKYKH